MTSYRSPIAEPPTAPLVLRAGQWAARRAAHERRVDAWTRGWRERRAGGRTHPVDDFLFTYYPTRPGVLRRWHPGAGVLLESATPPPEGYRLATADGVRGWLLDLDRHTARLQRAARTATLLLATAGRAPRFGCFGLHEWAMVYGQQQHETRHGGGWPLRLAPDRVRAVVDELGLQCTHFDAYRFFTAEARPLNARPLSRAAQVDDEQGGCLHANMDVYRHASALSPLVSSELVADCFALAREIRTLDMRAAPYDLRALGYQPVEVETVSGRAQFAAAQRGFAAAAARLRDRLLAEIDRLPLRAVSAAP